MAPNKTGERQIISTRFEPDLVEAVSQLQKGNDVRDRGEMVRLLVRRGIRAVAEDSAPDAKPVQPPLTHDQTVARTEYLVEMLGDLIARTEAHDPVQAVRLARAVAGPAAHYADALAERHGLLRDDSDDD